MKKTSIAWGALVIVLVLLVLATGRLDREQDVGSGVATALDS